MRLDENGILVYSNIGKNNLIYSKNKHRAVFSFRGGATVNFHSEVPGSSCKVTMINKLTGNLHYSSLIYDNMFSKSNSEKISPLLIKATDDIGNILLEVDLEEWAKSNYNP